MIRCCHNLGCLTFGVVFYKQHEAVERALEIDHRILYPDFISCEDFSSLLGRPFHGVCQFNPLSSLGSHIVSHLASPPEVWHLIPAILCAMENVDPEVLLSD